jgi:hypothetical protein
MSPPSKFFRKNQGVSEREICDAELATGLKFPSSYREFLSESNGGFFERQLVKILSLKESLKYFNSLRDFGLTRTWGYLPILDAEDSNPWCLCCNSPLAGYIVWVMHDDAAQIKFRSIDSFFSAIERSDRNDAMLLDDLEGDFKCGDRAVEDIEVARALVKNAPNYESVDRNDACRFAMWLFSEDNVDEMSRFLDDEDPFVARDALDRLKALKSLKAREAIQAVGKDLAGFVEKSVALLKQVGIQAQPENDSTVRVNHGILLDMKVFYAQRKAPEAEQKFIDRVKSFIAGKQNK